MGHGSIPTTGLAERSHSLEIYWKALPRGTNNKTLGRLSL